MQNLRHIIYQTLTASILILAGCSTSLAKQDKNDHDNANVADVRSFGAEGDGISDDTAAFRNAVGSLPAGGVLAIPVGKYRLSGTVLIDKPISIIGSGFGSQILEIADAPLFKLQNVNAAVLRDLYLGSTGTSQNSALIELSNSNHNRFDNITMLGGYFGVHLKGSLLNTFVDLRSGTNFQGFFSQTSLNQYWVFAERQGIYSSNANSFISPVLEGGTNGMYFQDPPNGGQGSANITGGSIEGVSRVALTFDNTFLPSTVTGTHFEQNGVADVIVKNSSNIYLSGVLALKEISLSDDSRNIIVEGGIVEHVTVGSATKRVRLQNITTSLNCGPFITNNNTGVAPDGTPNVAIYQVGYYCGGQ